MKTSLTRLTKPLAGFNRVSHGEDEFWRIARREKIIVHFWPLPDGNLGFYGVNKLHRRHYRYIVIDSKLLPDAWLPTAFHELGHHFLHVPHGSLEVFYSKGENLRHERAADIFSIIMRIPQKLLLELMLTPFDAIFDEDGSHVWPHKLFTLEELKQRHRFYERYRV